MDRTLALPFAVLLFLTGACAAEIGTSEVAEACDDVVARAAECTDLTEDDRAELVSSCMDAPEGLSHLDELECPEADDRTVQLSGGGFCNPYADQCPAGQYCHASIGSASCRYQAGSGESCSRVQRENPCRTGTCMRYCDVYECEGSFGWVNNILYGGRCG